MEGLVGKEDKVKEEEEEEETIKEEEEEEFEEEEFEEKESEEVESEEEELEEEESEEEECENTECEGKRDDISGESDSANNFYIPSYVCVSNISPTTTKEHLFNFFEAKIHTAPESIIYGGKENTVIVIFEKVPDIERLQEVCQETSLDGTFLTVGNVPYTNSVQVRNVAETTTQDSVMFYFENQRRSGGIDVSEVRRLDSGHYLVFFEDHNTVGVVTKREHKVEGRLLQVEPYMECIGGQKQVSNKQRKDQPLGAMASDFTNEGDDSPSPDAAVFQQSSGQQTNPFDAKVPYTWSIPVRILYKTRDTADSELAGFHHTYSCKLDEYLKHQYMLLLSRDRLDDIEKMINKRVQDVKVCLQLGIVTINLVLTNANAADDRYITDVTSTVMQYYLTHGTADIMVQVCSIKDFDGKELVDEIEKDECFVSRSLVWFCIDAADPDVLMSVFPAQYKTDVVKFITKHKHRLRPRTVTVPVNNPSLTVKVLERLGIQDVIQASQPYIKLSVTSANHDKVVCCIQAFDPDALLEETEQAVRTFLGQILTKDYKLAMYNSAAFNSHVVKFFYGMFAKKKLSPVCLVPGVTNCNMKLFCTSIQVEKRCLALIGSHFIEKTVHGNWLETWEDTSVFQRLHTEADNKLSVSFDNDTGVIYMTGIKEDVKRAKKAITLILNKDDLQTEEAVSKKSNNRESPVSLETDDGGESHTEEREAWSIVHQSPDKTTPDASKSPGIVKTENEMKVTKRHDKMKDEGPVTTREKIDGSLERKPKAREAAGFESLPTDITKQNQKDTISHTNILAQQLHQLQQQQEQQQQQQHTLSLPTDAKSHAEFKSDEGLKILVYEGNLLSTSVDCIVSATNENLQHGGGVARVIARAAGPSLTKEGDDYVKRHGPLPVGSVCSTTAGNLPFKCVIQAVGPCWYDYSPHTLKNVNRCEKDLIDVIMNSFLQAEKKGLQSIGLPAISSAIFGVPEEICVMQYVLATLAYSKKSASRSTHLTEVHFVDKNSGIVRQIQSVFKTSLIDKQQPVYNVQQFVQHSQTLSRSFNEQSPKKLHSLPLKFPAKSKLERKPDVLVCPIVCYDETVKGVNRLVAHIGPQGMLKVHKADLLNMQNVQICVFSVNRDGSSELGLDEKLQGCAQYVEKKGQLFKEGQEDGYVVDTHGGATRFKLILHAVIPEQMVQEDKLKLLKKVFSSVMSILEQLKGAQSMAIPLLGIDQNSSDDNVQAWMDLFMEFYCRFCQGRPETPFLVHLVDNNSNAVEQIKNAVLQFEKRMQKQEHNMQQQQPIAKTTGTKGHDFGQPTTRRDALLKRYGQQQKQFYGGAEKDKKLDLQSQQNRYHTIAAETAKLYVAQQQQQKQQQQQQQLTSASNVRTDTDQCDIRYQGSQGYSLDEFGQ